MKIEQRINGSVQLILTPENDIERAVLSAMYNATTVGKKVGMSVDTGVTSLAKGEPCTLLRATFTVEAQ